MVADCLLRMNLWFDAWKGGEGAFPIFGAAAANAGKGLDDDCLIAPHRPRLLQAARPSVRPSVHRGAQALLLISRNCCVMEKLWTTPSRPRQRPHYLSTYLRTYYARGGGANWSHFSGRIRNSSKATGIHTRIKCNFWSCAHK